MKRVLAGLLAAGATLGAALPLYREGPPPAHTGGFGEPTCAECHFGADLNDDAGSLTLDAPATFQPGETYRLEVRLAHPELAAAGFQLAVRFPAGKAAGTRAGRLAPVDGRTMVTVDSATGVGYGHHTPEGARLPESGPARWVLEWTAPDTAADVVVHAAANAANDDASEFGDFIFTVERRLHSGGKAGPASPGALRSGRLR